MSKTDSDSSSSSTSTSSSASSNQQYSNSDEEKSVVEKKKLRTKKKTKKYKKRAELIAQKHPIKVGNKESVESKTSRKCKHSGIKVYEKKENSNFESSSQSDSSSSSSSEDATTSTDSSSSDSEMEKKPKTERIKVGVSNKPLTPDAEKEKDDASKRVDTSVQEAQEEKREDKRTISTKKSEIVGENDEKEKLLNLMENEEQVKSTNGKENGEMNKAEDHFSSEKKKSNDEEYHYANGSIVDECRQNSIYHSKSRSHSLSSSHEFAKGRSKTPQQNKIRRSPRSRSRELQRKRRTRSRSRARARSGSLTANKHRSDRRDERRRSNSVEYERRRSRRSISLERRKEQRKKRHAERDEHEKAKRAKRDEENLENQQKELNKPEGDPDKIKELDNMTVTDPKAKITERQRKAVDLLTSRTGGAYIPPAKLRLMQAEITDKTSAAYQRIAWEALKKSIHGYINKVNVDNIAIITRELLKENIVRGRGLLCRSIIQAQAASPTFTHVYAALVAIINSKFPNIGELLLKRLVIQFKRAFRRNDKAVCLSSSRFIAHLVNQRVAHEILALEILTLLVESPTDDSVEVAIAFLKECGMKLTEVSSKGIGAIFEMLKNILHEGKLDKRVQYMIEVVFQVRKDGFKDHQSVIEPLELVEEDDQFTHLLMLDDATNTEDMLNAFKFDEEYAANEEKYKGLSKEILGSDASDSAGSSSSSGDESDSDSTDSDNNEKGEGKPTADEIIDNTETNLIALRRTIYLTINSSLDYEECAHKLMKMQLKPGQEIELCHMFLDCCAEQRTYEKFYGLLAQRFCSINKIYIEPFEEIFKDTYQTTHRLDTNRLRNVSKFFAHLLFTDAISWDVLECIKLNEDDTTSSSRIFIKILFQELAEYMGLSQLNKKLKDEVLVESLAGLFPKDNPRNTRFSINFFTSIGLGGLTDELRQFLKNAPKSVPAINAEILANKPINVESSTSTSSSSSSSSSSSQTSTSSSSDSTSVSSTSSSSSSSDTESDKEVNKKKSRRKKLKKTQKSTSSKKDNKRNLEKKKSKKKRKKSKNSKKNHNSSSETDSKTDTETSSTTESSGGSSNKDNADKRKSKKKYSAKRTEKKYKISKKKTKKSDNSNEEFSYKQNKKRQNEERLESNKDRQGHEYNENRRSSNDYKSQGTKRAEPERRDSEVERRREKREQRHSEREREDRKLSRSRSKTRDRRNNHLTREDRDRRNRDYERDRDSVRRRERKRYEDRKSRSRSRDLDNYAKRDRGYDRSKARNTSKERG